MGDILDATKHRCEEGVPDIYLDEADRAGRGRRAAKRGCSVVRTVPQHVDGVCDASQKAWTDTAFVVDHS